MDSKKYKDMLDALLKQEEEVKATFTKIQGAKEVVKALLDEAKEAEKTDKPKEGMKVADIDKAEPKNKGK
jgi:ribosomal protein L17